MTARVIKRAIGIGHKIGQLKSESLASLSGLPGLISFETRWDIPLQPHLQRNFQRFLMFHGIHKRTPRHSLLDVDLKLELEPSYFFLDK